MGGFAGPWASRRLSHLFGVIGFARHLLACGTAPYAAPRRRAHCWGACNACKMLWAEGWRKECFACNSGEKRSLKAMPDGVATFRAPLGHNG